MLKIKENTVVIELHFENGKIQLPVSKEMMMLEEWECIKQYILDGQDCNFKFEYAMFDIDIKITRNKLYIESPLLNVSIKFSQVKDEFLQILYDIKNIDWITHS